MENKRGFIIRNGVKIGAVGDKNFSTLHIGCITPYLGTKDNVPRGYLLADGASYKTTDYPELFDIIGYTYGGSDGTFNVPNLCDGRFLEGSDTSGEYVEAGLPNIEGELVSLNAGTSNFKNTEFVNGAFSAQTKWNSISGDGNTDSYGEVSFDASKSNPIYGNSDTVQPKSLRVLYIIKAFHTNEGVDSGVSDDVIEYVDNKVDALVDDTTSSTTSTWSSSKIASIMPTTRSLTLKSGYAGYITETYDPTTKVVVYNVNVSGTFKGLLNSVADGFRVPKGSTSSSDVMHQTIGIYGSNSAMTGDAQFTRLLVRNYGNPHLEVDVSAENTVVSGTITYVTA